MIMDATGSQTSRVFRNAESRIGIPKKGEAVLAEAQSRLSKMLEKSWLETTSLTSMNNIHEKPEASPENVEEQWEDIKSYKSRLRTPNQQASNLNYYVSRALEFDNMYKRFSQLLQ